MESLTHLLFFDVDATGKRIYDELVSLSLTNQQQTNYNSFIMPSCNFNDEAKYRLNLSIANSQNVRVMKDTKSRQAVPTKSLYIVMKEFLTWLKENNPQKKKLWLMFYGVTNLPALLLLKSLKRFKLYDDFMNQVEYIINLNEVFKESVEHTLKSDDPKVIFSVLLDVEETEINITRATSRLPFVYKVFNHLLTGMDQQDVTSKLSQHARLIPAVSEEMDAEFVLLETRSSLDPIFKKLFSPLSTRAKYVKLRNDLAEHGMSYEVLKQKVAEDKLKEFIEEKFAERSEETIKIITNHFAKSTTTTTTTAPAPAPTENAAVSATN